MVDRILRNSCKVAVLAVFLAGPASAFYASMGPKAADCGEIGDGYGPFDYRTAPQRERDLVESAHFLPYIENLIRGKHGPPGVDIDYTLRAFPNHHRALLAMMNLGFKEKTDKPQGSNYTVQCWFERGIVYTPDDGRVYMLFGIYLMRIGDSKRAVAVLEKAQQLAVEDSNLYYNLGLAYFKLKDYDKALANAQQAYRLGFPLPGLRNMLQREGKWQDARPAPDTGSTAPNPALAHEPAATEAGPRGSGAVLK